jgi:hypothetical protein
MYAFVQDVPIDRAVYQRIKDGLGEQLPEGLLVHLALEQADGTLRYVDVWRDQEACERFVEQRLHPVVGPVLAAADIRPAGEPPRHEMAVVDLWGAAVPDPIG